MRESVRERSRNLKYRSRKIFKREFDRCLILRKPRNFRIQKSQQNLVNSLKTLKANLENSLQEQVLKKM